MMLKFVMKALVLILMIVWKMMVTLKVNMVKIVLPLMLKNKMSVMDYKSIFYGNDTDNVKSSNTDMNFENIEICSKINKTEHNFSDQETFYEIKYEY